MQCFRGNQKAWEQQPFFENEDEDDDEEDLSILAEDSLERAGGLGRIAFVAEANLVGCAAGFDGLLKSGCHPDWVGSDGDRGIYEDGISAKFHGLGCMAGCTESCIHDHGYESLVDDDSDLVPGARSLVATDRRAQRHYRRRSYFLETFSQDRISIDIRQ